MTKTLADEAERIYKRYAITVMNPEPIENLIPDNEVSDKIRYAYERGIVHIHEQVSRLCALQESNMNQAEPYDVGFMNALKLAAYVMTGTEAEFMEKPKASVLKVEEPVIELVIEPDIEPIIEPAVKVAEEPKPVIKPKVSVKPEKRVDEKPKKEKGKKAVGE